MKRKKEKRKKERKRERKKERMCCSERKNLFRLFFFVYNFCF